MNAAFLDYKTSLSVDVPMLANVEQFDIITREPSGPFGAKEAGEGPGTGVLAALANAIYDATGVRVKTLPISPEKLLFALRGKNVGG